MEIAPSKPLQNDCASLDLATASALQSLHINDNNEGKVGSDQGASNSNPQCSSMSCHGGDVSEEVVLHKLAKINGVINKMVKEQLQDQLKSLGLNSGGVKEVLRKRLKNYHRRQRVSQSKRLRQADEKTYFDYLVVIDYEATCARNNDNFVHEIIEFPAVLIDVPNCVVSDVFQRFCRPTVNPRLTAFCTELTGITQAQVDEAKDFKDVYQEFQEWLKSHGLGREHKFAIVTDGPWDMARFLRTQMELSGLKYPSWARQWINLRKSYSNFYNVGRVTLHIMLQDLGMVFQGRPHCGLDDAQNIGAIALCLLKDGCIFKNNEALRPSSAPSPKPHSQPLTLQPRTSQPRRKGRFPAGVDVEQEGENVDDLLLLARLKKS